MSFNPLSGGGQSLFSSVFNIAAQAALGVATGGASLLVTTALKGVMLAIGDQVLQQIGQQLGVPQSAIDFAQGAFHAASGDPGGAFQNLTEASGGLSAALGGGAFEAGEIERGAQSNINDIVDSWNKWAADRAREEGTDENGVSRGGRGRGASGADSLLVAIAKAMGKIIDKKMGEMRDKTEEMGTAKGEKYGQLSAEVQALGQEISMISAALNNSIKSIGEASSQLARKG